jgi:hypothetical protein
MFIVPDPFSNRVCLYEKTWLIHTLPKHDEDPPDLGDVRESVLNPDQARRSLNPNIGNESCVFEKFIGPDNRLLRTPVIYDLGPGRTYEAGGNSGRVMTSFYPDPLSRNRNVGEIFWSKPTESKEEEK